ncbi:hypothetical protein [Beijerinckia mobilis]|uniref:hypothetical protein n=1 Tax=Beijerinckia mobilis TaxID=231434 RepID=UPI0005508A41|nr:hypothetical protein [Beijerinckia mobilis]
MSLSAIVFCGDDQRRGGREFDLARAMVASLSMLVPLHIEGIVRDIVIVGPEGLELPLVAEHAGCDCVEAASEAAGLHPAAELTHEPDLLLLKAGHGLEPLLVEECRHRMADPDGWRKIMQLTRSPENWRERYISAACVGLILPGARKVLSPGDSFSTITRRHRGETRLPPLANRIAFF